MNWKKVLYFSILVILLVFSIWSWTRNKSENLNLDNSQTEYIPDTKDVYVFPPFYEVHKNDKLEFDISQVKTLNDKLAFSENLRKKLFNLANFLTYPDKSPKIQIINQVDKGTYTEQKISIMMYPSTISYAYMLIPKNITYPAPLILAMHQHGDNYDYAKDEVVGNKGDPDLFYGKELAERGYLVFAPDAPLFGDRVLKLNGENSPQTLESYGEESLILLGHSLLGETLREDISILNLISSLKNIDQNKIGCIGHSFGGVRCMYLAALDDRIKVVVLSNSVANLRKKYTEAPVHTWFNILPNVAKYTETNGILTLIAPRPLIIIYTEKDPIFPVDEAEGQIKPIKELYSKLYKESDFASLKIPNEAHAFPEKYHEIVYKFLDKYLK